MATVRLTTSEIDTSYQRVEGYTGTPHTPDSKPPHGRVPIHRERVEHEHEQERSKPAPKPPRPRSS